VALPSLIRRRRKDPRFGQGAVWIGSVNQLLISLTKEAKKA